MKRRRHTAAEIAAKLEQADAMSSEGRPHGDIAKALGVTVMTYHRWRKSREASSLEVSVRAGGPERKTSLIEQTARVSELQAENSQLRRLVTDLLLEKMTLEESVQDRAGDVTTTVRR